MSSNLICLICEIVFFLLDFSCDPNMQMKETIRLEQDIFVPMAGSGKLYVYHTDRFWSQIKTSGYVSTAKWIKRVCVLGVVEGY